MLARQLLVFILLVVPVAPVAAQVTMVRDTTAPPPTANTPPAAPMSAPSPTDTVAVPFDDRYPPSEGHAQTMLERSPRHGEFVDVPSPSGVALRTWVSYPERKDRAGTVLIIHEIFGLTDWIRGVADQLAKEGFIAVAPDLISGLGPGGGGTDSVASRDDVVKLVRTLTPEETTARLNAVRAYAAKIPAANGKVATMGFCWGGGKSFAYAANDPPPQAAVVYYGVSPDSVTLPNVRAPVLGLYGGDDARVNMTIDPAKTALKKKGRSYDPHLYDGAGHGFLRTQTLRGGANLAATRKAWPETISFLKKYLK
jgi:carboxymethylenebutenolidase